jgi:hypothetical protein
MNIQKLISKIFGDRRNTTGIRRGRMKFRDAASASVFTYRMGAGVPGTVSRMNPAAVIEPVLIDPTAPPTAFGVPVVIAAASQGARVVEIGDVEANIYGILVRPYPFQQLSGGPTANFNSGGPGVGGADVLRSGYILAIINTLGGQPVKGQPVYIWTAASGGGHTLGGFETAASGGNTIAIPATFQGGVDANGVGEIAYNV